MNKKLYIYSILLAIVYTVFIGHSVYDTASAGFAGFKLGLENGVKGKMVYLCGGDITPTEGNYSFPSTYTNEKTGEIVRIEFRQVFAYLHQRPVSVPVVASIMQGVQILTTLLLVGLFIWLPFIVYRMMRSISKNEFYSLKNINDIRKISFIILGAFLIQIYTRFSLMIQTNSYLELKDYRASFGEFGYSLLFLGLVVLILSEILRYTSTLKEEQAFTI